VSHSWETIAKGEHALWAGDLPDDR